MRLLESTGLTAMVTLTGRPAGTVSAGAGASAVPYHNVIPSCSLYMLSYTSGLLDKVLLEALDAAALTRAREILPSPGEPRWLAERIAADLPFSPSGENGNGNSDRAWAERLRDSLAGRAIDAVVQANAERRKRLLIADMDSTMIGQECVDELADRVGLKARVAAITERAMRGDIAFEPALRERVRAIIAAPVEEALGKKAASGACCI